VGAFAAVCIIKVSSGSSRVTMLDLLIITLVLAFLALSYAMLKVRRKATAAMPVDQPTRVKSVAFHPTESSWMILALYSGHVVICKAYKSVRYAVSPGCVLRACLFGKHSTFLAASDDGRIRVLDHDGRLLHEFQAHDDYIRSLDIVSDRSLLLSCCDDMTIKAWDMDNNYDCVKTFHGHMHYVMQVRCHPHETGRFATASLDRTIQFWSVDEVDSLYALRGHEDGVNSIDFCSREDPLLVSASDDLTVRLWNYESRQQLHVLRGHEKNVSAAIFLCTNDNSASIVSTSEDCTLRFWRCSTANEDEEGGGEAIKTIQYLPLGRGWALATKGSATADVENQVAIGLDKACLLLDVLDETYGTITVSKEINITEGISENAHVPVGIHADNVV